MALIVSNKSKGLAEAKKYSEFVSQVATENNVSLNDSDVKRDIDNLYLAYSSAAPTTTTNTGTTAKLTSATQSTVTGLLGTQDISRIGAGYQMSSLESTQDTIFQLSDVSKGLFDVMNESKNVGDVVKNLAGVGIGKLMEGVQQVLKQEVELRNKINSQLGLTGELSREARNNILETLPAATSMAFGFEEVSNYAVSLVENTGKMTTFGADVLQESQKTARAFYGDLDKLAGAIDGFEKVGIGAKDAIKEIDKAGKSSLALGLNARKVVSELDQNMSKLNSYGFKNGVEGLTRMVQKSIEFNLNMSTVLKLADDAMDPDKAIALSAELQAIGGAIGDFNDPLKLMYMATNDAGGLQDALIGVAGSLTTYNSELGKFEISGANLRKAKALASELGMNYEELANTAIKASERSSAATALLSSGLQIDEKEKEFLTNISKMEGGQMVIDVPKSLAKELGLEDTKVALDELSPAIAKGLIENQQAFEKMSVEDIARDQYTTTQNIQKDVSALLTLAKVRVAGGLREPLSQVDKYLEDKLGNDLKKKTTAELKGNGDLGAFWNEVGLNTKTPLLKSFEELQNRSVITEDALKDVKNIGNNQQTVNHNHTLTIKSNDAVVDATTRAIVSNPSVADEISNTVIPDALSYTSPTLPSKFY